ncbi:MAG: chemotaxis response regulator protein-glutamate methylesterase [bacterium]
MTTGENVKSKPVIRVMVVEDSTYMQYVIRQIIDDEPDMLVVETARDGLEALEKLEKLTPDVITLDIQMPRMNGLEFLGHNQKKHRIPTVLISSLTHEGAAETIRGLELGAVDFVPKPTGIHSLSLASVRDEIISKVRIAHGLRAAPALALRTPEAAAEAVIRRAPVEKKKVSAKPLLRKVVVIGASTGGPRALTEIIPALPGDLPAAVLVVQHMPPKFTRSLAERLNSLSSLEVVEAEDGQKIRGGTVYVAPGDHHMRIGGDATIVLSQEQARLGVRPSIDILMRSAAGTFKKLAIGVVLTGMGTDGTLGLQSIKDAGGVTIAESEESSVVFGMPRSAIEARCADNVLHLGEIAEKIVSLVR